MAGWRAGTHRADQDDSGGEEIIYAVLRQDGDHVSLWLSEDASIVGQKEHGDQLKFTLTSQVR